MRNRFDRQLDLLNEELTAMGAMCEESIALVAKALSDGDLTLAEKVRSESETIDSMEREIENHCMKLLLHQQPVAKDLRQISAALKMITDMERIGVQTGDIAEIIIFLKGQSVSGVAIIEDMARATIKMVTQSVDAFVHKDTELAKSVIDYDDVVDGYFEKMKGVIINMIKETPNRGEFLLDLLMISKYFERIGDHALGIAGTAKELTDKKIAFSPLAQKDIMVLRAALTEITGITVNAFTQQDAALAHKVEPLEQVIDILRFQMKERHIDRLQTGECTQQTGFIFSDLITNCQRVSDHCSNLAVSLIRTEVDKLDSHEYLNDIKSGNDAEYTRLFAEYSKKYTLANDGE